jgi:hypothetical protein
MFESNKSQKQLPLSAREKKRRFDAALVTSCSSGQKKTISSPIFARASQSSDSKRREQFARALRTRYSGRASSSPHTIELRDHQ